MRILLITYIFSPEPIVMSTITKDLAMYLASDHEVTVLTSKPCRPYGYDFSGGKLFDDSWPFKRVVMDSYIYPSSNIVKRLRENRSFGKNAVKFVEQHHGEIDAIYLNVFPLFAQKMLIECANKYHIRVVNHIEDIFPEPFAERLPFVGKILNKTLMPIDKWNAEHADQSVVIGNQIKTYYVRTRSVNPDKIKVVYNWQDESRYQEVTYHPQERFTFAYVGSVSKAAGIDNIIRAFGESGVDDSQLFIAGSGSEKATLMEYAKQFDSKIVFTEAKGSDVAGIQSSSDVLILPLRKNISLRAVPSKLAAYLFTKRPILAVAEKESDVASIIKTAGCGWVVEPGDFEALKMTIIAIANTARDELTKMGERGYEFSQQHHTKAINLPLLANILIGNE